MLTVLITSSSQPLSGNFSWTQKAWCLAIHKNLPFSRFVLSRSYTLFNYLMKNWRIFYYASDEYEFYMDIFGIRIWTAFYVIAFTIFAVAVFSSVKGVMIWVCLLLAGVVLGISFVAIRNQMKMHSAREEMQRKLVEGLEWCSTVKDESLKTPWEA